MTAETGYTFQAGNLLSLQCQVLPCSELQASGMIHSWQRLVPMPRELFGLRDPPVPAWGRSPTSALC